MAGASVPVIVGPTAGGKSAIAMWLARRGAPLTIVSADSRHVYRGFDVGTAKPTAADRAAVPHECIDIVDPHVRYSAFAWAERAAAGIAAALAGGRYPLVVGGTGMYVRTLFDGGFTEPPLDASRREALHAELATMATEELRRWCRVLDPPRAALGRVQLLRSVEIALLAGSRLSALHASSRRPSPWRARYLVVDPGPELGDRIAARARAMLDGAWQAEVAALCEAVPADAPAWKSSGYGVVRSLVTGDIALDAALERVVIETRQYAKRQRTWFRHQLPAGAVTRVDPTAASWQETVARWWDEGEEERTA